MPVKPIYPKILVVFVFVFISSPSFSQANEIKIKFIANCGLYLTDGNANIYVDFPYKSGAHHYTKFDKTQIDSIRPNSVFIFTHKHSDHYSSKVKKLKGKIYGPKNVKELEQPRSTIKDFSIQAFKTKHRFSFNHCSYLITWHGKKIFISGDTENAQTIAGLSNMDLAFVPAWILMDAIGKNLKIDAKTVGIYHIGPRDKITIDNNPKFRLMNKQGEVISLPY